MIYREEIVGKNVSLEIQKTSLLCVGRLLNKASTHITSQMYNTCMNLYIKTTVYCIREYIFFASPRSCVWMCPCMKECLYMCVCLSILWKPWPGLFSFIIKQCEGLVKGLTITEGHSDEGAVLFSAHFPSYVSLVYLPSLSALDSRIYWNAHRSQERIGLKRHFFLPM